MALLGMLVMHALPMHALPMQTDHAMGRAVQDVMAASSAVATTSPTRPHQPPGHVAHALSPCAAIVPALNTLPPPAAVPSPLRAPSSAVLLAQPTSTSRVAHAPPDLDALCISRT